MSRLGNPSSEDQGNPKIFDTHSSVIKFASNIACVQHAFAFKEMLEGTTTIDDDLPKEPLDLSVKTLQYIGTANKFNIDKVIPRYEHFTEDCQHKKEIVDQDLMPAKKSYNSFNIDNKFHKSYLRPGNHWVSWGIQVKQDDLTEHDTERMENGLGLLSPTYSTRTYENKITLLEHYRDLNTKMDSHNYKGQHQKHEYKPYPYYLGYRKARLQEDIATHFRVNNRETPFACKECGRFFSQIGNLQRHMNIHRGERPHQCTECDCRFADPATLRNHLRTHTGELPFVCQICNRGFSQVGNLKRHMSKHAQKSESNERPYRCTQCGQGFAHESTLRNHFRTHTGEQPYRCTLCARAFSQIGNLKRHMAKHASQQDFLCGVCQSNFSTSNELLLHECPSKQQEYLTAVDCRMITPWVSGQFSGRANSLSDSWTSSSSEADGSDISQRNRKRSVSDDDISSSCSTGPSVGQRKWKIFPCQECGKVYTWQHDLKIHFRIHSGEKPYSCDICGKKFAQSGAIRTHKKRHHSEDVKGGTTRSCASESITQLEIICE